MAQQSDVTGHVVTIYLYHGYYPPKPPSQPPSGVCSLQLCQETLLRKEMVVILLTHAELTSIQH